MKNEAHKQSYFLGSLWEHHAIITERLCCHVTCCEEYMETKNLRKFLRDNMFELRPREISEGSKKNSARR
jgi:hypothetical protein